MNILSCMFNMDTVCVELKSDDGSMIAIDTKRKQPEVSIGLARKPFAKKGPL